MPRLPVVLGDVFEGGEAVLEAAAGAVDRDDVAVVQEPVEDGGGQDFVAEDLAPFIRGFGSRSTKSSLSHTASR